jgi:hypothetical protein
MSIQPVGHAVDAREQGEYEGRFKAINKPMVDNFAEVKEVGGFRCEQRQNAQPKRTKNPLTRISDVCFPFRPPRTKPMVSHKLKHLEGCLVVNSSVDKSFQSPIAHMRLGTLSLPPQHANHNLRLHYIVIHAVNGITRILSVHSVQMLTWVREPTGSSHHLP